MASLPSPWSALADALAASGLNTAGVADGAAYGAHLPGCRAALVFGSGGPDLWRALVAEVQADPTTLTAQDHPLDAFVRRRVQAADAQVFGARTQGPRRVWVFPDHAESRPIAIQRLALAAGLGWESRLHLVLHPNYGVWMGLRAVCFTVDALPVTGPLTSPSPCETCPAPCVAACPGAAFPADRLDWKRCTIQRVTTSTCPDRCHSRVACPEGASHRYPAAELAYHHDKRKGRAALAASLGVEDPHAPAGTDWAARLAQARKALIQ